MCHRIAGRRKLAAAGVTVLVGSREFARGAKVVLLPTAFRLKRGIDHKFHVDSYQPRGLRRLEIVPRKSA